MAPSATPTAPRRRSERQLTSPVPPPPKKTPRRSSKTDPNVKPLLFWSPEEVANLVQAWRDTIANPPVRARATAGGFNMRMYKRFVELCGGTTIRALQSAVNKKQLLNNSFQFISKYNERRRSELAAKAGGCGSNATAPTAASSKSTTTTVGAVASKKAAATASSAVVATTAADAVNFWFELSKAQRKTVAIKSFMTEQRQFALLNMNRVTYDSMLGIAQLEGKLNVRQPWTDDEMELMFRAWREALTKRPKGNRNPLFSLNTRTYEFMVALSAGAFKRTKQSVVLKKDAMRVSYEFITEFNRQRLEAHADEVVRTGGGGSAKKKPVLWFQLAQREQERIVARDVVKSGFVYFTDAQYRSMETLVKDTERLGAEHGVRQGVMWTHDENVLLLKAWRDVADKPLDRLRANATYGSCIYERFMHISKGAYSRSERSTVLKLMSIEHMYEFIDAYNHDAARESRPTWFALERQERRREHLDATRAKGFADDRRHTFTDFDRAMFDAMAKIVARNRPLDAITYGVDASGDVDESDANGDDDDDAGDAEAEGGDSNDKSGVESSELDDESESDYAPTTRGRAAKAQRTRRRQSLPKRAVASIEMSDEVGYEADSNDEGRLTESEPERDDRVDANASMGVALEATPDATNSFLQVRLAEVQQQPAQRTESAANARRDGTVSDIDSDGTESATSHRGRRAAATTRSSKKAPTATSRGRSSAQVPTPFSLHELADLAMRVNTTAGGSSSSNDGSDRDAGDGNDAAIAPHASSNAPKKRNVGADVAAMVQILQAQSMQMVRVMEEIRDEIRFDRERFLEEMRLFRQERRGRRTDDKSDLGKRSHSSSSSDDERSPGSRKKQKKSSRRLSVQRDGFVVRL